MVMWGWVGNSDEALAVVRCNSGDAIAAGPWDDSGEAIAMKQIAVMQWALEMTAVKQQR